LLERKRGTFFTEGKKAKGKKPQLIPVLGERMATQKRREARRQEMVLKRGGTIGLKQVAGCLRGGGGESATFLWHKKTQKELLSEKVSLILWGHH